MDQRYPLSLHVNPLGWRVFSARKEDPAFESFANKVFARDRYTCRYCGFQARVFQEVVNLDQNYDNNKVSNLITACCFCTQCLFIESCGLAGYGGGSVVYLPEMTQPELNSFCHVLFCAISNDTGYRQTAQSIYRSFKFRAQMVDQQFGDGTSNPSVLGQLIIEAAMDSTELRDVLTRDLRILPSRSKFKTQIDSWAEIALEELSKEF